MTRRARAVIAVGAACAVALLLSPAVVPDADALVPGVLPLGFFAAGACAAALRPGSRVADRLLAVGVLHLAALVGAVAALAVDSPAAALALVWPSAVLYALGFVALLDLLARYPTGAHAWARLGPAVRGLAVVAAVLASLAVLGSERTPSLLGPPGGVNPLHLPVLSGTPGAVAAVALLPVAGLALLVARYRGAPGADREQMRWPLATTAVVAVGLLTTAGAERALGPAVQSALFVAAGVALPASFLVGLLRHGTAADRLAEVEASRARIAAAADAERRRVERDLHDGAQQHLLALLARVEVARATAQDGAVERELAAIAEGLRAAHRELRELARGVHPAVLTDHGLAEAVRAAAARVPGRVTVSVAPEVAGRRFPPPVEAAGYFLALEGLTNAMRHADPGAVGVSLGCTDGALVVAVTDDGRGFDPAPGDLDGLRDRLAAAGGSLRVESRPGRGTTLRGSLPVGTRAGG